VTVSEPDPDVLITDSGGRMVRVRDPGTPPEAVGLSVLADLRRVELPGPYRGLGGPPYFRPGELLSWYSGRSMVLHHVVRDDDRGLVAWQPAGSEMLIAVPVDGRGIRDRPVEERATVEHRMGIRAWRGPGVLRIAPAAKPWALWYFFDDVGAFTGHYVNLELVHERPVSGEPRVHTRDLTLDLWIEEGENGREVWLKDEDELDAAVAGGRYTAEQGAAIRAIGELARYELGHLGSWPLDEDWESWRPPAEWDAPLALPDLAPVLAARALG
jgi:hypothetical protein